MHQSNMLTTLLPLLLHSLPTNASPTKLLPRVNTGSSTDPTCFYNYNDGGSDQGTCPDYVGGGVNMQYCQQSIIAVCNSLAQVPASNMSSFGYQTGTGVNTGPSADCYAAANNGKNAPGPMVVSDCMAGFARLQGCAENTNVGFNPGCIGGTINDQFNTNNGKMGQAVDINKPRFALGPPNFFGVGSSTDESFNHPDPQLAADTSDAAAAEHIQSVGGLSAKPINSVPVSGGALLGGFAGSDEGE